MLHCKVRLSYSKKICPICLIESPLEVMKTAFLFNLKSSFLFLKALFRFLSGLFGHIQGFQLSFLMVGETNSLVGYHLMTKGHSIQLGIWGEL